ncbi:MFS transporter [Tersicoccus sp. MR15.9]|uniref:MFS transporter n=1 Tax=Tersicoccus mangrovi TaxID=3121635 RepID=UPI002FE5B820
MSSARPAPPSTRAVAPLYAAGFTTAFGAHSVAAGLGAEVGAARGDIGAGLLALGVFLALYDLAEVVLKPVFGSLADRIGPRPVIVVGLLGFAVASLVGIASANLVLLAVARLGQGAAASAFSPASSAAVARLAGARTGRAFGRYGSWKSLGYALGPLIGAGLILAGGLPLLFGALAVIALVAAGWAAVAVPAIAPLRRPRYTLADLARQLVERSFLGPTAVLAASTGSLGAAVGFLPAIAAAAGLGTVVSLGAVTVLALASVLVQPGVGRARDAGRIADRPAMAGGLALVAVGIVAGALGVLVSGVATGVLVYVAAALIGTGIAVTTPVAFAHLADATPPERMGRTMGTAELGRELGDAGGPLLVGAVAAGAGIGWGLGALAVVVGATATAAPRSRSVADS